MGQRPVSDLEKHIREPPQLAQAGIFHPLHEQRIFVLGSQESGARSQKSGARSKESATAYCLLLSAFCLLPSAYCLLFYGLRRPVV